MARRWHDIESNVEPNRSSQRYRKAAKIKGRCCLSSKFLERSQTLLPVAKQVCILTKPRRRNELFSILFREMPGANCCIVDCPTYADNGKYPHLSFFRVPTSKSSAKSEAVKDWRAKLLHIISRADQTFNSERAFTCSRHFSEDCIRTGN